MGSVLWGGRGVGAHGGAFPSGAAVAAEGGAAFLPAFWPVGPSDCRLLVRGPGSHPAVEDEAKKDQAQSDREERYSRSRGSLAT